MAQAVDLKRRGCELEFCTVHNENTIGGKAIGRQPQNKQPPQKIDSKHLIPVSHKLRSENVSCRSFWEIHFPLKYAEPCLWFLPSL